ncbi:MAG: S8 family serine peptidase [Clostridiales bacterium]|nr:S8 family serine peptidase [Clostridiales bacterium]
MKSIKAYLKCNGGIRIIKIVLIDSGIDERYLNSDVSIVHSRKYLQKSNGEMVWITNNKIEHLHGTIVTNIILSECTNIEIIDFNILDNKLKSNGDMMVRALKDAIFLKPDIINLSLGTVNKKYFIKLYFLLKKAKKSNVIVVASESNIGEFTLPANLSSVIGVKTIHRKNSKKKSLNSMMASGVPVSFNSDKVELESLCSSNSYATGAITGFIAREMSKLKGEVL